MYEYTDCGLEGIVLKNGYEVYQTDYGEGVGIHDLKGLHSTIGLNIVCNKPSLSYREVRFLRKELELSQSELGRILGVVESSIRAWEKGRSKIAKPADRLLRNLYREMVCGESKVRELLDRIASLNRDTYHDKLELEETENGWIECAA